MNNRLINTKVAGGGGGCTDIVDNYDPFGGNGVALYQLNGDATDVSGNYNGTATNVTYGTGVFGQAGVFNGSTSAINTTYTPTVANLRTVSLWFKTNSTVLGAIQSVSPYGISNNYAWEWIYMLSNGTIAAGYGASNGGAVYMKTTTNSYNDNSWHHLALTLNGVYGAGSFVQLYIDGNEVSTSIDTSNSGSISSITGTFRLGSRNRSGVDSNVFNGSIDQVRIFNTALTPLEIEALYTEELCICDGTVDTLQVLGDTSCIATYQLDGNANDLSGNYSGTPTNVSYGVGEFDLAGVFNGSSSQIATTPNLIPTNDSFSVSTWVNSNLGGALLSRGVVFTGSNFGVGGFLDKIDSDYKLTFYRGVGSSATSFVSKTLSNYNDATWNNIVYSYDYSSSLVEIYCNGVFIGSGNTPSGTVSYNASYDSGVHTIGQAGRGTLSPTWFNGSIDQVRIFNKALSAGEVTTLYNETACTKAACTGTTNTLDILGDGSCIAAYPLDGSPLDLSGNYNGVQTDVTYPQGYFDLAGSFNGTSSYVNAGLIPSVNSTTFSVSCWVNFSSISSTGVVISNYHSVSGDKGWWLRYSTGNKLEFAGVIGGTIVTVNNSFVPSLNTWYHIVAVKSTTDMTLYIDGSQNATASYGAIDISGTPSLYLGRLGALNGQYINGKIDQVRIFNKALSLAEVGILYNNETPCN